MERFMYWRPGTLSEPHSFCWDVGCDEWHNKSVYVILPFLGGFVLFWERKFSRKGPEHAWSYANGTVLDGVFFTDCQICLEVLNESKN